MSTVAASTTDVRAAQIEPASAAADEHEHTLIIDFTELVHHHAVVLPRANELAPGLSHLAHSRPAPGRGPIGDHELDLGMRPLGRAEVAPLPVREDRAHEVQVRRWHRASLAHPTIS